MTDSAENDALAKVNDAIALWETKGPTSLTVALMAEALYAVRGADPTHGRNHAPLPEGILLDPGYCEGCDAARVIPPDEGYGTNATACSHGVSLAEQCDRCNPPVKKENE